MKKIVCLLALFLAPMIASANAGYYLQAEGGLAAVSLDNSSATNALFSSSSGFGGRLSGGYLWGDNNFNYGLETGIFYAPSLTSSDSYYGIDNEDIKIRAVNVDLLGVVKYTFNNGIALFAKGGGAYTDQHLHLDDSVTIDNYTVNGQPLDTSGHKIAPEAALGFGYQFNPNIEMDLTTNVVFAGSADQNNPAATNGAIMLGLTYHFA